jgi:hypothetical protein
VEVAEELRDLGCTSRWLDEDGDDFDVVVVDDNDRDPDDNVPFVPDDPNNPSKTPRFPLFLSFTSPFAPALAPRDPWPSSLFTLRSTRDEDDDDCLCIF